MKALIDTNVILDFFLYRELFYKDAEDIFQKMNDKKVNGYISASAVTDIFYLIQKEKGYLNASNCILKLMWIIEVLGIDKKTIINALLLNWKDFEDAVQAQVAMENKLDIIITRNPKDYKTLEAIQVITPHDFAEKF
jgi:putative PIN family toxin of toxin-antitoxin system